MDDLIARINDRVASPDGPTDDGGREAPFPPVRAKSLTAVEAIVGHKLPPLLERLYSEVGNGGFGPDYGLLGIDGGAGNERGQDAISLYQTFRVPDERDPLWRWPPGLLPLVHCGCGMFLCVDCSSSDGKVVWFEPNPHESGQPWDDSFIPLTCDLGQLMTAWVDGESWYDRFIPAR